MPKITEIARIVQLFGKASVPGTMGVLAKKAITTPAFFVTSPPQRAFAAAQQYVRPGITPCLEPHEFFNRRQECQDVETVLNSTPQISLFLGPPNSGKTTLLQHVLSQMVQSWQRPVLHLDLRGVSFHTPEELYRVLAKESPGWLHRMHAGLPNVSVKANVKEPFGCGADFEVDLFQKTIETVAVGKDNSADKLNVVFDAIDRALPARSLLWGKNNPVLFIDEANRLKVLLQDNPKEGNKVLSTLFEWLVQKTKQQNRFHVMLGSSSSFFHLWVSRYMQQGQYESYVIGDLTREEAKRYWEEQILTQPDWKECQSPNFKMAYEVCGGNIMYLRKFALQWKLNRGQLQCEEFSLVRQENMRLYRACNTPDYFARTFMQWYEDPESVGKKPVLWTKELFLEIAQRLVSSPEGFLAYEPLCDEFNEDVINSLIKYHLLHLRPNKEFGYDLPSAPKNAAVVTAMSPSARYAMKLLLQEHGVLPTPTEESEKVETDIIAETAKEAPTPSMRP